MTSEEETLAQAVRVLDGEPVRYASIADKQLFHNVLADNGYHDVYMSNNAQGQILVSINDRAPVASSSAGPLQNEAPPNVPDNVNFEIAEQCGKIASAVYNTKSAVDDVTGELVDPTKGEQTVIGLYKDQYGVSPNIEELKEFVKPIAQHAYNIRMFVAGEDVHAYHIGRDWFASDEGHREGFDELSVEQKHAFKSMYESLNAEYLAVPYAERIEAFMNKKGGVTEEERRSLFASQNADWTITYVNESIDRGETRTLEGTQYHQACHAIFKNVPPVNDEFSGAVSGGSDPTSAADVSPAKENVVERTL